MSDLGKFLVRTHIRIETPASSPDLAGPTIARFLADHPGGTVSHARCQGSGDLLIDLRSEVIQPVE